MLPTIPKGGLVVRGLNKFGLVLAKHGPKIMIWSGCGGMLLSIYEFCRAAKKSVPITQEHQEKMVKIQEEIDRQIVIYGKDSYDKKACGKMIFDEKRDYAWKMSKLYFRPTIEASVSMCLILGGEGIISRRLGRISAYAGALEESFGRYRENVRLDAGEDKDREYLTGIQRKQVEAVITDDDGNEKKVDADVYVRKNDDTNPSIYAFFFDEYSTKWVNNAFANLLFLRSEQSWANDILWTRGYIFLDEIIDALGIQVSREKREMMRIVGWYLSEEDRKERRLEKRKKVDFNIYNLTQATKRAFIDGYEPSVLLDFNVDGVIWDKVWPKKKKH